MPFPPMHSPLSFLFTQSFYRQNDLLIGHLQDDAILLLRPESSRVLLSCANENFCLLTLAGISKRHERKN